MRDHQRTRRIPWWGLASVLLLVGGFAVFHWNFYLQDTGHRPIFTGITKYYFCVVVQVAAAACGIVAVRRESTWWLITVLPALLMAVGCYFSEI